MTTIVLPIKAGNNIALSRLFSSHTLPQYNRAASVKRLVPNHIQKPQYAIDKKSPKKPSHIEIKTKQQIAQLRESCLIARRILASTAQHIKAGITTDEIDELAHNLCVSHCVYPSPMGYNGYPKSVCTSVNHVACHGVPCNLRLKDGDILNLDVTVFFCGYHGDVSETYAVGKLDSQTQRLVDTARQCRDDAIAICRPGTKFCELGKTISDIASENGFSVIPNFCGHGIGTFFHGPPDIIHVANEEEGIMEEGMAFTIEPIISEGEPDIRILDDGWTAVSLDGSRSAQFEHTVVVTRDGVEVLTT